MDAYLAPAFAALACSLLLLLPLALRQRSSVSADRDAAWRDELPAALRFVRPAIRWYAPGVDRSLASHKREVLQAQLNAAGAAYLITPAEFLVIRRFAFIAGIAIALYVIFVLRVTDPLHIALLGTLAPFTYLYPSIRLREATQKRQSRIEKDFPFFL